MLTKRLLSRNWKYPFGRKVGNCHFRNQSVVTFTATLKPQWKMSKKVNFNNLALYALRITLLYEIAEYDFLLFLWKVSHCTIRQVFPNFVRNYIIAKLNLLLSWFTNLKIQLWTPQPLWIKNIEFLTNKNAQIYCQKIDLHEIK